MDWSLDSGLIGAAVTAVIWWIQHSIESARRVREAFQIERFNLYVSILQPLLEGEASLSRKGAVKKWREAILRLNLMAPDEVARAAHGLFDAYSEDPTLLKMDEQVEKMATNLGGLMLAIRKDLGNPATALTDVDMMRVLVRDIGGYFPAQRPKAKR